MGRRFFHRWTKKFGPRKPRDAAVVTTQVDGSDYSDEEQIGLFAIVPVDTPAESQDEPAVLLLRKLHDEVKSLLS